MRKRRNSTRTTAAALAFGGLALGAAIVMAAGAAALSGPAQLLSVANSYVGVEESPKGSNRGPIVDQFNGGNGLAWCSYFVSYVLAKAGFTVNNRFGGGVRPLYDKAASLNVLSKVPTPGAVFIMLQSPTGAVGVDQGHDHTGFVVTPNPDGTVTTIEGNASDGVRLYHFRKVSDFAGFIPYSSLASVFA